jgi:replicative DNA helicase
MRADRLKTPHTVLAETNDRLTTDEQAGATVWPSGFGALDMALAGGFRSGELVLLGSRPGLGKTTFALQVRATSWHPTTPWSSSRSSTTTTRCWNG